MRRITFGADVSQRAFSTDTDSTESLGIKGGSAHSTNLMLDCANGPEPRFTYIYTNYCFKNISFVWYLLLSLKQKTNIKQNLKKTNYD